MEATAEADVKRVMVDQEKYMDWQNQYAVEMNELAEKEWVELEAKQKK